MTDKQLAVLLMSIKDAITTACLDARDSLESVEVTDGAINELLGRFNLIEYQLMDQIKILEG